MRQMDGRKTISQTSNALGMTARERSERFRLEALAELALRLVGGLMVAGSTMLWLVLPLEEGSARLASHGSVAALFTAAGLFVYAFGTRGFRRQLALDARRKTLTLTKININGQGRIMRSIAPDRIESLFLRRPAPGAAYATLCVRLNDSDTPLVALAGDTGELEKLHRQLCDMIQRVRGGSPVVPVRPAVKSGLALRIRPLRG